MGSKASKSNVFDVAVGGTTELSVTFSAGLAPTISPAWWLLTTVFAGTMPLAGSARTTPLAGKAFSSII